MAVTVGINGFGCWEQYTKPCLWSIEEYEPLAQVVVCDNDPDNPYPKSDWAQIVKTPAMSYAGTMNYVVKHYPADWYLILNNDVLCTGPFLHYFERFDPGTNYGCRMLQDTIGRKFIETWMIIFSQESYDRIGPWDEKFLKCAFEDADWGYRAAEVGVNQSRLSYFPFVHLQGSRWSTEGYSNQRELNFLYLEQKHGHTGGLREWKG